jgi:magnesium chelatase family protein
MKSFLITRVLTVFRIVVDVVEKINSIGILGMNPYHVSVEADVSVGMPSFDIVGLPDASVKESRDRVRSALKNSNFEYPVAKIVINLAPADVKKFGPIYDLPILIAILKASRQIHYDLEDAVIIGELSLFGDLNAVSGVLPMTLKAKELNFRRIFLPFTNAQEGAVVEGINIFPIRSVREFVGHLKGTKIIKNQPKTLFVKKTDKNILNFSDVKGQQSAKRALEVAAAGGHNILLIGPPGAGKSMLAQRIPTILPEMTFEEMIETTKIYSISGLLTKDIPLITNRPFRAPHHMISTAGLTGGGSIPRPGELSMAHNGVLFLDELPEFSRFTLEALRQPLEEGKVTVSRVKGVFTYLCDMMFVAAMNPCPCGYYGHPHIACKCSPHAISKYLTKISGPLLDRIDIHIEVPPVDFKNLCSNTQDCETSESICVRINRARKVQVERYKKTGIKCNAKASLGTLEKISDMADDAKNILKRTFDNLNLSARAYTKILKISRTIADLDSSLRIEANHVCEAVQYRNLDRRYWAF